MGVCVQINWQMCCSLANKKVDYDYYFCWIRNVDTFTQKFLWKFVGYCSLQGTSSKFTTAQPKLKKSKFVGSVCCPPNTTFDEIMKQGGIEVKKELHYFLH